MVLIDCGEGTQVGVKLCGWGFKEIGAICFTHYHADHIAGLTGLLLTIANSGRTESLSLFGPPGLKDAVTGLMAIVPGLPYDLRLYELPADKPARGWVGALLLSSEPLDHTVPCLGYSLVLERAGRFDAEAAARLEIPKEYWKSLQNGQAAEVQGKRYEPDMVLGPPRRGIKVTYCTDSRPTEGMAELARGSDLLICEGIYGEEGKQPGAAQKKHMVFSEAAQIARISGSRELWLTHFSPALKEPEEFIKNARRVFSNTEAGRDGMKKSLGFENG